MVIFLFNMGAHSARRLHLVDFSQGIARDLPFGVVDFSHSQLSRQLIREVDATSTLLVSQHFASVDEASQAMRSNQIYGFMVIPHNSIKPFIVKSSRK